jgi:hypothetical protein
MSLTHSVPRDVADTVENQSASMLDPPKDLQSWLDKNSVKISILEDNRHTVGSMVLPLIRVDISTPRAPPFVELRTKMEWST